MRALYIYISPLLSRVFVYYLTYYRLDYSLLLPMSKKNNESYVIQRVIFISWFWILLLLLILIFVALPSLPWSWVLLFVSLGPCSLICGVIHPYI